MRLQLLWVGKPGDDACSALFDRYTQRIARFGIDVDAGWVAETRAGGRYSDAHVRSREARALLDRVRSPARRIALDPAGRALPSERWGERVESWLRPGCCLFVGGPLGLGPELLEAADERLSLGPITLPHELARVVAVEQFYRALTLARGIPYHK